jgi:hypothetical protein
MFVSDANAPLPTYDVDVSGKDNDWWSDTDNALKVSNSFFLDEDDRLFDDLLNCELPDAIGAAMYNCWYGADKGPGKWAEHITHRDKKSDFASTWENLLKSNKVYHYYRQIKLKDLGIEDSPNGIHKVFGSGFVNPYTSNNVIIAQRENWKKFLSGNNKNYWNKTTRGYNQKDDISHFPVSVPDTKNDARYEGFPFFLGLPPEHTGSNDKKTKFIEGGWR